MNLPQKTARFAAPAPHAEVPVASVSSKKKACVSAALFLAALNLPVVAETTNLTQVPAIKAAGTYTYYARGDSNGTPLTNKFTTAFYPGPPRGGDTLDRDNGRIDGSPTSMPGTIPFAYGDLTDNDNASGVSGWINIEDAHGSGSVINHAGTFDILFDLGAVYPISSVEVIYADSMGRRWVTTGTYGDQEVSTAVSLKGAVATDTDFTRFKFLRFIQGSNPGTVIFENGAPRLARYVNLRLSVTLNPDTGGSIGGYLREIRINGEPRALSPALRADDFVETIGVNTHFKKLGYTTAWDTPAGVAMDLLKNTGIRYIRDDMPIDNDPARYGWLNSLYTQNGIRTTWVPLTWVRDTPLPSAIEAKLVNHPFFDAVEGANEPENSMLFDPEDTTPQPYIYNNVPDNPSGHAYPATRAWQADVYTEVDGNPALNHVRVIAPAMASPHNIRRLLPMTAMHTAAMHSYPRGRHPGAGYRNHLDSSAMPAVRIMAGGSSTAKPVVATETGYHTALNSTDKHTPVSESAQAKYIPRLYAEYLLRGISQTFAYELIDAGNDLTNHEKNFGWVKYNHTPKPVYTRMKRLIAHLGEATWDSGTLKWTGGDYGPDALSYTIHAPIDPAGTGVPPNIRHLLLQKKSTGQWIMLLWNEVSSYDHTQTPKDLVNPAVAVKLAFNRPIANASLYKLDSDAAVSTHVDATTLTVNVPDELLVVKLTPAPLPAPWKQNEVSNLETISGVIDGSATAVGDHFTVTGAGRTTDSGNADGLHFVNQPVTGDFTLSARVTSAAVKAGITARVSTAAGAKQVSLSIQADNKVHLQRRESTDGGLVTTTVNIDSYTTPRLLKLERSGNTFTAWHRKLDDAQWTSVGTATVTMPSGALAGLGVCSASLTTLQTATFSEVSLTPTVPVVTLRASIVNPMRFVFHRTPPLTSAFTVNYTTDGTAVAGTHYTISGSAQIGAGQSSAEITVAPAVRANTQGRRSVIFTLAPSSTYLCGEQISDSINLNWGNGVVADFNTSTAQWSCLERSEISLLGASGAKAGNGALRWTYKDNGTTRYLNELRFQPSSLQNWSEAAKMVLWIRPGVQNDSGDIGKEILYDYRNGGSNSVSGGLGVGSFTIDKSTTGTEEYRRIELDLGPYPRNTVSRFFFYVDGDQHATGDHIWDIDEIMLIDAQGRPIGSL
jgi:hypothetical protein